MTNDSDENKAVIILGHILKFDWKKTVEGTPEIDPGSDKQIVVFTSDYGLSEEFTLSQVQEMLENSDEHNLETFKIPLEQAKEAFILSQHDVLKGRDLEIL